MKRLPILSCLFLLVFYLSAAAQKPVHIRVDMQANTIAINETVFTGNSTIDDYERVLGQAGRIVQKRGADQYFAYDQLGIALSVQEETYVVNQIYLTYLYDGDIKVAREVFKGSLTVNEVLVDEGISSQAMSKLAGVELVEVMNGYFLTPKRPLNLLLYYPQDRPYTSLKQLGLTFSAMR